MQRICTNICHCHKEIQWKFFIQKRKFNNIKEYKEKPIAISIFGNIISNMERKTNWGTKVNLSFVKFSSDGKLLNFTKKKEKKKWYWHCLAF